jgi:rhodanese-related sulfurtransferase
MGRYHEPACNSIGRLRSIVPTNNMKTEVDACGAACRGQHLPLVDIENVGFQADVGIAYRDCLDVSPMRCGASSGEKARRGQDRDSRAQRHDASPTSIRGPQCRDELPRDPRVDGAPTRDHDQVRRTKRAETAIDRELQTGIRSYCTSCSAGLCRTYPEPIPMRPHLRPVQAENLMGHAEFKAAQAVVREANDAWPGAPLSRRRSFWHDLDARWQCGQCRGAPILDYVGSPALTLGLSKSLEVRMGSYVTAIPAASSDIATKHFAQRLTVETDCADVADAMRNDIQDFVLLHVVGTKESYGKRHLPGAIHLPHREITAERMAEWSPETLFVTYCAGPHCNGADQAALKLARLGRPVKIMIGGITGWADEGLHFTTGEQPGSFNASQGEQRSAHP